MSELWSPIEGAPNYHVSNMGRVRRVAGYRCPSDRILKLRKDSDGYLLAHLSVDGRAFNGAVHRLVCTAFVGPRPTPRHQVGHRDGCRTNNAAANLRWVTAKENADDREAHGRTARGERSGAYTRPDRVRRGEANGMTRISEETVQRIRGSVGSCREIAARFAVSKAQVSKIRAGRARTFAASPNLNPKDTPNV